MTGEDIANVVSTWQKRLRLLDWKIRVMVLRHYRLDSGNIGQIRTYPQTMEADLKICHPKDWPPEDHRPGIVDPEHTIVHELVHLLFEGVVKSDGEGLGYNMFEAAINKLCDALLRDHGRVASAEEWQELPLSKSSPRGNWGDYGGDYGGATWEHGEDER